MPEDFLFPVEQLMESAVKPVRVANGTPLRELSTLILRFLDEGKQRVALECIGAPSVNIGIKAVAIANEESIKQGRILVILPSFELKSFADRATGKEIEMTAIRLLVSRLPVLL